MAMGSWENAGKMLRKCWENEDYLEIEWENAEKIWGCAWHFNEFHGIWWGFFYVD
jgi:hypothetical protein